MDPTRQIRLLIAPFFLFASFALAYSTSAGNKLPTGYDLLAWVAVLTLSTLPVGFFINTLTFLLLRILFRLFGSNFETRLSEKDIDRIWPQLNTTLGRHARSKVVWPGAVQTPKYIEFYVAATFDHGILRKKSKGVHEWITRVYNAFITDVSSLVAILLSYGVVALLCMCPSWQWWLCTAAIVIVLFVGAWQARETLLNMFEFQTHRRFN